MFYQAFGTNSSDYFKKETGVDFSFPQHLHPCLELIVLQEGEMRVNIDNSSYLLHKNDAVFIFPNQIHSLESTNSKHTLFLFSTNIVKAYSTKNQGLIPKKNMFSLDDYMVNSLNNLSEDSSNFEIKGALYTICGIFDRITSYQSACDDKNNLLVRIFRFVEQNYTGDCSLEQLSKDTGYEYTYISRIFKRFTGLSYNEYVNTLRLNHAGYLLHNTDLSMLECAMDCGYNSLRTFNRNFKDTYGMAPNEYRKKPHPHTHMPQKNTK